MAILKTMTVTVDGNEIKVGVLDDKGNPVYEIDGKEVGQDLALLRADLTRANGEAAERRVKLKEAEEKLAVYGDLDPEKARLALSTVSALDDKSMIDAKQVEVMKAKWEESFKANKAQTDAAYEAKIKELEGAVDGKEASIKRMLVRSVIDQSKYLDNTIYGPLREDAYLRFGGNFDVQPGDNGDYKIVPMLNGQQIISVARPGQVATPDEALEEIIKAHPQREHILKGSQASGSGTTGGSGGGGSKTNVQKLQEQYDTAFKNGNFQQAVGLKDQIVKLMNTPA